MKKSNGQRLVWKLIKFWKPPLRQILAVPLFVGLFWLVYRDLFSAALFLFSMYWHEFFHAVVYELNEIRMQVLLLFPLGAVAAPVNEDEEKESEWLPWNRAAWLMQAGIVGNVSLMFLGIGLSFLADPFWAGIGARLVTVNVYLAIFNLIPVWTLDAGQMFFLIFSSLEEKWDRLIVALATLVSILLVGAAIWSSDGGWVVLGKLITNMGWIAFVTVTTIGIWRKSTKDDPRHYLSTQAMTNPQVATQLLVWLALSLLTVYGFRFL